MGPRRSESIPQDELFRNRLENLIDQRHELVRLAALIDWEVFDREWGSLFSQTRAPAIAPRLIAGLHYLKHLYKLFDEVVVPRWVENAYHQCLCGETYFQHQVPIHPTSMTRWRKRMGEEGFEWLLTQTIEAGRESGVLKDKDCRRVNVDTTVQEKAGVFPTDSKLLDDVRRQLVKLAEANCIQLRQNYTRTAKTYRLKISRYAHAKQYGRMRREFSKLRSRVGRVVRDIERKLEPRGEASRTVFSVTLAKAHRLPNQKPKDKGKPYSVHAPEVECISKGKAHTRYEFGVLSMRSARVELRFK